MKDKIVPLAIFVIFALGTLWMINGMNNVVKMTQPNAKSANK